MVQHTPPAAIPDEILDDRLGRLNTLEVIDKPKAGPISLRGWVLGK